MRILNIILTVFLTILISANVGFAQQKVVSNQSIFDEISFQETIEVTFEVDMESLLADRRSAESHPTIFTYSDENGKVQSWDIELTLRGKFRRTRCENMPPLKLNFKKKKLKAKGLAKFDDMKLVTQCVEDERLAKQLVIKEYMTYKLYNQISDKSFRVQFVKINFKDSKTGKVETEVGFLIEDTAQLRNRLNAEKVEQVFNLPESKFESENIRTVAVFQYMIGNPDWSIGNNHNLKLLKIEGENIAVPYDFDFSGIVNAPYTMVSEDLMIKSAKERVYLGFEKDILPLESTLQLYTDKKDDLIKTIKDSNLINGKTRRGMIRYINSFYKNKNKINFKIELPTPPTLGE